MSKTGSFDLKAALARIRRDACAPTVKACEMTPVQSIVLLTEIPQVVRSDLYVVAALAGAAIVVIGHMLGLSYGVSALVGGAVLRPSLHGNQAQLESARRTSVRARPRKSGRFE